LDRLTRLLKVEHLVPAMPAGKIEYDTFGDGLQPPEERAFIGSPKSPHGLPGPPKCLLQDIIRLGAALQEAPNPLPDMPLQRLAAPARERVERHPVPPSGSIHEV